MNEQLLKDLRDLQIGYRAKISQLEREIQADPFDNIVKLHGQFIKLTGSVLEMTEENLSRRLNSINKGLEEERERSKTWDRTRLYADKSHYGAALVALNELLYFNHDLQR